MHFKFKIVLYGPYLHQYQTQISKLIKYGKTQTKDKMEPLIGLDRIESSWEVGVRPLLKKTIG